MLQPRNNVWIAVVIAFIFTTSISGQENIDSSRPKREDNGDVTTVLLVDNHGRSRSSLGRFLNVKPAVGLLTSTARTFIQDGVTTEYATQVLGTTLDNGRLYAHLLTKSSRVLYPTTDNVIQPTAKTAHTPTVTYDQKWRFHHLQDEPVIQPSKSGTFLVFATTKPKPYQFPNKKDPLQDDVLEINTQNKQPSQQSNEASEEEILNSASSNNARIPYQEPFFRQRQQFSTSSSSSSSVSTSNNVKTFQINPAERNINLELIPQPQSLKQDSRENDVASNDKFSSINPSKIRPRYNIPTFTVRNEFSPSGYLLGDLPEFEHDVRTERTKSTTAEQRRPKLLYRGGQPVRQELKELETVTYSGFADFTTTVGDTVIIFSPHTSTKNYGPGQVTTISGDATLNPSKAYREPTVTSTIKTFLSHDPAMKTETVTGHKINMQSTLPTMVIDASNRHREPKQDESEEEKQENLENKLSVLAHEQGGNLDTSEKIQPSETTPSAVMLSTPSDEDIAKIFASLAALAKQASSTQPTEPLVVTSTQNVVNETPTSTIASSTETETKVLGGATTIFFEDDFNGGLGLFPTQTFETFTTKKVEERITTNPPQTTTQEITTESLPTTQEQKETTRNPPTEKAITTTENEIATTDNEGISTVSLDETTPEFVNEVDLPKTDKPNQDGNDVEISCSDGGRLVPTTVYKTLTYLTTFFIPVETTTTTSIKSNIVVSTEIGFQTESCDQTTITPTTVQDNTTPIPTSKAVTTTEQQIATTNKEEQATELTSTTEQQTTQESQTGTTPLETTPFEITTESKHVTESESEPLETTTDSGEEIELIFKTLYTTYTYLTTFFQESTSSVSSRKVVITNVITSTLDPGSQSSDLAVAGLLGRDDSVIQNDFKSRPASFEDFADIAASQSNFIQPTILTTTQENDPESSNNEDSVSGATPSLTDENIIQTSNAIKTYYTTYTYFTTIFVDGETEISSRTEVYTNYVTPSGVVSPFDEVIPTASLSYDLINKVPKNQAEKPQTKSADEDDDDGDVEKNRPLSLKVTPLKSYNSTIRRQKISSDIYEKEVDIDNNILSTTKIDLEPSSQTYTTLQRSKVPNNVATQQLANKIFNINDYETISTMVTDVQSSSSKGERRILDVDKRNILDDQIVAESNNDSEISPSPTLLLQTSFTTFTYFTTMYFGTTSSNVVSRLDTITNVVTETLTPTQTLSVEDQTLPITYFTTFTYWTTLYKDGSTTITSREETVSNVVTPTVEGIQPTQSVLITQRILPTETVGEKIVPTKAVTSEDELTTFYTTYTYFTTSYLGNSTILNSRLETVTNIVNNTNGLDPQTARAIGSASQNILADNEKIKSTAVELPGLFPTGLLSTLVTTSVQNDVTTLFSTDVYGTYIDGLYAKVLESTTKVITDEIAPSTVTPLLPTGVLSLNQGKIVDAEGVSTLFFTTQAIGTYIDQLYAKVIESTSSLSVNEERKAALPTEIDPVSLAHRTGLVRLIEGSIVANRTTTIYQSKVLGTVIDGRYAQVIESTSSFIVEKTPAPTATVISPTATIGPDGKITPTATVITPSPVVIEGSLNEGSTRREEENTTEDDEGYDEDDEDGNNSRVKSRLTFQTKKRTFTPAIRPFASRNRPTFAPKRKGSLGNGPTTITRSDFTPTITATPALKSESTRGRFANNRRQSSNAASASVTPSGSRRFSRTRTSGSSSATATSTFSGGRRSSTGRIQPTITGSRRGSSGFRSSSPVVARASSNLFANRGRIRPTLSSSLQRGQSTVTTPSTDATDNGNDLTTLVTDEPTDFTDNDSDTTLPLSTTTESGLRRSQNPLLRFRRPPLPRPAVTPTTPRTPTTQKKNGNLRKTTTTTPKPKGRAGFTRAPTVQTRPRAGSNLFPRRDLFKPRTPPPVEEDGEEGENQNGDDTELDEDEDTEYEGSDTNTQTEKAPAAQKRKGRASLNPVQVKPFIRGRRSKRQVSPYSRFRRPTSSTTTTQEPTTEAQKNSRNSRFRPRSGSTSTQPSTSAPKRISPSRVSPTSGRSQFTLREKDTLSSRNSNFKRPTSSNNRRTTSKPNTLTRPKAPRLRTTTSKSSEEYSRSNSRSKSTSSRTGRGRTRGPSRATDQFGQRNVDVDNNFVIPTFDGTITITHQIPTEATIPVVNGKITEYKNIVTAKLSTEVLSPLQYTTRLHVDGREVKVLTSEATNIAGNGATEVTQFILNETPTTSVIFTPTYIRGRRTSFSHIIPSTVYGVEQVVSTIQPALSAQAPLANILLSQLLLGNLGIPQQNPLLALQNPGSQTPQTPTTEFKTRTTTYVTTVTDATSTIIPITFRGKEILTTIVETSTNIITATEFITDTVVVTPTAAVSNNQLNSLLLPLLLQQQQPALPLTGIQQPTGLLPIEQQLLQDNLANDLLQQNSRSKEIDEEPPSREEIPRRKVSRKKTKIEKPTEPTPPKETSVITLYVSGKRPGEFSTVLSTVTVGEENKRKKRELAYVPVKPSRIISIQTSSTQNLEDDFIYPAMSDVIIESSQASGETESLESIIGDVSKHLQEHTTTNPVNTNTKYVRKSSTDTTGTETVPSENEGRRLNEEARYNLATRVMSNGVEVIVAGDKTTYPGEPNVRRILSTTNRPLTLAPSTLTDHMMMLLPQDASEVAHLSSSLYQNQFVTKTCLTTYTYLTTFLENGSTKVSSHEQVVSNIATEERNSPKIVATPTASSGFTLTQNSNLATGVFHTTYTYLYTILDDEQPLVITSKHTVANTVTAPDDYLSLLQPSESATPVWDTNTYLSTIELTKTLTEGTDQKVISTKDVITQVVITESVPPKGTSVMTSYIALDVDDIAPSATREYSTTDVVKTYFVTYTYYNTYLEGDKTVVKTNVSTSSDIVTEKLYLHPKKSTQVKSTSSSSNKNVIVTTPITSRKGSKTKQSSSATKQPEIEIYATKTYQTTYTYFTTFLQDSKSNLKSPIISSNTKTVENVVTEKIATNAFDSTFVQNIGQSLQKNSLKSVVTTATLPSGEQLEITAVNKFDIKPTKSIPLKNPSSMALPLIQPSEEKFETTTTPNVITGSTIIFFDDEQIDNLITPSLNTKPSKIIKSTIRNELGNLLSSEIVHNDQSVAEAQNNYKTSILGSKTIISTGATLQPGDQVIVVSNNNKSSTIIPVSDPNKKKHNNKNNKNSANKTNSPSTKPATTANVSNLLGSLNINSLTALGPVFNAMAGLIQNNLHHRRNDNTTTTASSITTILPAHVAPNTTPKVSPVDGQNRSPIYIPVGGFADEILESAESQNVATFDLNLPPQIRPDSKWINEESKVKNHVLIGKPTHESPLVNGGIPISPGQVITANSDVIVGKPAILGPRIPNLHKNKGPHHEDETPLGMKPPPPPKRNWPKRHNELYTKDTTSSLLNVPAIPLQHFEDGNSHKQNNPQFDTIPQFTNIKIAPNNQLQVNNQQNNQWFNNQVQPTPVFNNNNNNNYQETAPPIIFAKPALENKLKPPIGDPISLPEVIERSTGQHLLVNIQPSQVANVIIPHGSTTALIFGGASEPHKNGQYFDDPSPYPEPEVNSGFVGVGNFNNNEPSNYANQKPVSGVINVDSQSIHHGIDVNVPPLSFGIAKPPSSGVINLDSHIIKHDINVHVPPISFGMVNHGDDFTAHIISHDNKYNVITESKDHGEVINEPNPHFNINNNRPTPFNGHQLKIPIYTHVGDEDININVSPQPLPNLKPQEHVVPNGIVLDATIDNKLLPNYQNIRNRPNKRPIYIENLTPPTAPTKVYTRPRPNFSTKLNPLEFMTPPPVKRPTKPNHHNIRTENYNKPITIPLNYDITPSPHIIVTNNINTSNKKNNFKPDDYSGEDPLEDSSEENEDGEVIQESKTRPLRPGQIPYEVLKVNVTTTTTTTKPISLTTTSKPFSKTPLRGQTGNIFKKIPTNPYQYAPENPRPFRPNQNDRYNKVNQHHITYPLRNNKTDLLFPPVIKEGIHRHNPYIPFGTVIPNHNNRPQIITPKPGYKLSSPHFSTSMPIQEIISHNNNNLYISSNNYNIQQSYHPTSMPVDSKEDFTSTTSRPDDRHHYNIHNIGLQTEEPFNSKHTTTTQQSYSFSNNDVLTTEAAINSKSPQKVPHKTTEKQPNINRGDTIYKITEIPPHGTIYNKNKFDFGNKTSTNAPDMEIQKLEKMTPPKINATIQTNIIIPDIDMKPPKLDKISPNLGHVSPVFDLKNQQNTQRPYLVQTPSAEMKPPPPMVEYTTPHRNNKVQVMGLSPPPLSSPKPALTNIDISTYRPAFTFPKTTKDTPPYTFETPSTTAKNLDVSSSTTTTSYTTRLYSRFGSTTEKPLFISTTRPIFRWTKSPRPGTITNASSKYSPTTERSSTATIRPTTVRKQTTPHVEIILGHPPNNSQAITTEKINNLYKDQNRNDNNNYEIRKPDLTKLKPSLVFNRNKVSTTKSSSRTPTIYTNLYTKDTIEPSSTIKEIYNTAIHHAGNEIKIVEETTALPKAPTQIKDSKVILPTKYITHTQTLTVTTTKTTVVKSLGAPPSTLTLLITKTKTSTIIDTVTQTHTLVQPTNIIETVTTTISHTSSLPDSEGTASTYPAFPVQATAILHPQIIPTIIHENIHDSISEEDDLDDFIIKDTEPPLHPKEDHPSNHHHFDNNKHPPNDNDSIFVVMTDKKPNIIKVPKEQVDRGKIEDSKHPHRDEVLSNNDVNRVLLGGILIASPPSLESPDIGPPGVSNECRPDCKASRNELCQRVEGHMRCVCRPGFARMFPDRPCKPTYTYKLKVALYRNGKDVLKYQDALADQTSPQYIKLASATHEGLDRMVMQSDLRDIYHGVQVNEFEKSKDNGVITNFYLQLSENSDETRLKEVFKKYLRNSNYSLGGTEIFAARELVDDLDANDFDECTDMKYHDCSEHAQCFNLKGTYTCSCKEGFADLSENQLYPGRICSAELIGCERCHYHGTCYSRGDEQVLCECFQWYAGEYCHINLKVLLIALVTLGAILFTLLVICLVLTCVKRRRPEHAGLATGMSFLPHRRPVIGARRAPTLDRRAMIQDTSSEGSDTLPYVQKKQINKKPAQPQQLKGALKKPPPPERRISEIHRERDLRERELRERDPRSFEREESDIYVEQRDRSLTVMIPRAKYHPAPPTSPLLNITSFEKRKNSVASSNEAKLLSYLDAGPSPQKNIRRKHSNNSDSCLNKSSRKLSSGALVSAGFEVSATVCANNMGTLGTIATTCGTEADRSENATLIQKISADLLSSTGTQSQFTTLRKTIRNDDDEVDNWLDITPRVMTVSEARSYDETTIQPPTKSLRSGYDSKPGSHNQNNDEANTMAERDLGSTFLLPHTHLYKPDRGSDISGFDSL